MAGTIRVEGGAPAREVAEAVLFPFDDHAIPFTRGLLLNLVPGSKMAGDYLTGSSYDPEHPVRPVVRLGPPGAPDCREVICPTVIRVGDEYRMWYVCRGESERARPEPLEGGRPMDARRRIAYAVSRDGITWEKPALGPVEYAGSSANNLVAGLPGWGAVLHDPEDPDPGRRFKAIVIHTALRLGVAYSPDGLHWTESPNNPVGGGLEFLGAPIRFNGCFYVNGQGGPGLLDVDVDPHLITCPLRIGRGGARIHVNADGLLEHSFLTVELLDERFRPLAAYAGEAYVPVRASGLRSPVVWRDQEALEELDQPIRVRMNWRGLRPEDARVYAAYLG